MQLNALGARNVNQNIIERLKLFIKINKEIAFEKGLRLYHVILRPKHPEKKVKKIAMSKTQGKKKYLTTINFLIS